MTYTPRRLRLVALALLATLGLSACDTAFPPPLEAPVIELDPGEVRASRSFAGPTSFPPDGFAGYGILAFEQIPTRARGAMFCNAYLRSFSTVADYEALDVDKKQQMVTVWPVLDNRGADRLNYDGLSDAQTCDLALAEYGLPIAQTALNDAKKADPRGVGAGALGGRGPYLLAWSPGGEMGDPGVLVLVSDLSKVESQEQADAELQRWGQEIEQKPALWSAGWNAEALRITLQRWADFNAASLLSALGIDS